MPTETVYGLAANALNPSSVAKIFEIKRRPSFDPLILHISKDYDLGQIVNSVPEAAEKIIQAFWPGAITIILPKCASVPDIATSGLPTVAVRCPAHPVAQELLTHCKFPLAAPSANPFGRISPTTAEAVEEELGDKIPAILDGGPCELGIESTIIDFAEGKPAILRPGAISAEDLEPYLGPIQQKGLGEHPEAPGMLKSHYAPRTPLYLAFEKLPQELPKENAYLFFDRQQNLPPISFTLSAKGDLREAAANLFQAMRELDQSDASQIYCEPIPDYSLGRAINDRLIKASSGAVALIDNDFIVAPAGR